MTGSSAFETYTCTDDFKRRARQILPKMFYDYVDAGSWSEQTYHDNERAFSGISLRQRVARNVSERSTATTILGTARAMPLVLSPVGMGGMNYPDAELIAAKVAGEMNIPYTLSTLSIASIEDVAAHCPTPFWFQLYVMKDRGFVSSLIERAKAANCSALVLTLDLQVATLRHKDVKNNLRVPVRPTPRMALDLLRHPRWGLRMLRTRRHNFGNIVGHAPNVTNMGSFAQWIAGQLDDSLDWQAVEWIRSQWPGKLILKGIIDAEDARLAAKSGADAIVVSNHGGRVLDGARPSIDVLPEIVEAVADDLEIHVDSGIRSGQDIFRSVALGAQAAHIGRTYIYALAAGGEPALRRMLAILKTDLEATMGLCGENRLSDLSGNNLVWT